MTDPREKVGQIFQRVDKIIALNGIDGVFPVKEIATQIVKAIQPVELRRRVEYELSTIRGKETTRDLRLLYNFLITKCEAWYEMFPSGFINPPGRKAADGKPGANLSKIKCFKCNKLGHKALDCTEAKRPNDGGARKVSPGKVSTDRQE